MPPTTQLRRAAVPWHTAETLVVTPDARAEWRARWRTRLPWLDAHAAAPVLDGLLLLPLDPYAPPDPERLSAATRRLTGYTLAAADTDIPALDRLRSLADRTVIVGAGHSAAAEWLDVALVAAPHGAPRWGAVLDALGALATAVAERTPTRPNRRDLAALDARLHGLTRLAWATVDGALLGSPDAPRPLGLSWLRDTRPPVEPRAFDLDAVVTTPLGDTPPAWCAPDLDALVAELETALLWVQAGRFDALRGAPARDPEDLRRWLGFR